MQVEKQQINVAIIGAGVVGRGTASILVENAQEIAARAVPIGLRWLVNRNLAKAEAVKEQLGLSDLRLAEDWRPAVEDPETDVVVEVIGGTDVAFDILSTALSNGKSAVTANKDLIATRGGELLSIAKAHGSELFFEASVGGGIPIIQPLKESLAGNRVEQILGIVNGTTNFILTNMTEQGMDFETALAQAQELGYAESDPTADVEGLDAARKMAILASIAFNSRVTYEDVYCEGITKVSPWDILYSDELGYVIKMLGIARCDEKAIEVRVHPVMIAKSHPLASVRDSYNAIFVHGDAVENAMFYGRGAGSLPTGSAVVGDIINAARNILRNCRGRWGCTCYRNLPVLDINETKSKYYIRIQVDDRVGVFAALASSVAAANLSMDAVLQKRRLENGGSEIVMVTHEVRHKDVVTALDIISRLDCTHKVCGYIRVEG